MLKRFFDFLLSALGLLVASPILLVIILFVWLQDGHAPFYIAPRVGRAGREFRMVKMRSMVIRADSIGASSTAADDNRITKLGHLIRRYKIDELTQLWNVLIGDMSLVGPRPQVQSGVNAYTANEMLLLSVRPGITDFASIVFSDEGEILRGHDDPDRAYDELIRPGKSRLGLFYIEHQSISLDFKIILITIVAVVSRERAIHSLESLLGRLGASDSLRKIASRRLPLSPMLPP